MLRGVSLPLFYRPDMRLTALRPTVEPDIVILGFEDEEKQSYAMSASESGLKEGAGLARDGATYVASSSHQIHSPPEPALPCISPFSLSGIGAPSNTVRHSTISRRLGVIRIRLRYARGVRDRSSGLVRAAISVG